MSTVKTSLITCQQCGRRIMVRPADVQRGSIVCSHTGCGATNLLATVFQYDQAIVQGLPGFGELRHPATPDLAYPLRFGANVIGTGDTAQVRVERYLHDGRCYISRRHCTLTVTFDNWSGRLRYQLQDGAADPTTQASMPSLNGTQVNGSALRSSEQIDVTGDDILTLGGLDAFQLVPYTINPAMLATYRVELDYNPDRTQ